MDVNPGLEAWSGEEGFVIRAFHCGVDPVGEPEAESVDRPLDGPVELVPLALREGLEDVVRQVPLAASTARPARPAAAAGSPVVPRDEMIDAIPL